ncbi:phospholipase, partial [Streptomyces sp. JJ36]|nr:phospholipase [Streptomyces sp. JJ36]
MSRSSRLHGLALDRRTLLATAGAAGAAVGLGLAAGSGDGAAGAPGRPATARA